MSSESRIGGLTTIQKEEVINMNKIQKSVISVLCLIAVGAFLGGCATPTPTPTPVTPNATTITDLQNAGLVIGNLDYIYVQTGLPDAALVGLASKTFCDLGDTGTDTASPTAFAADVQSVIAKIWTTANASNTVVGNAIALAINDGNSLLQQQIASAGGNAALALDYINAFVSGFCQPYNPPTATSKVIYKGIK